MKYGILISILLSTVAHADESKPWTALRVFNTGRIEMTQDIASEHVCRETLCYAQYSQSCADREQSVKKAEIQAKLDELDRQKRALVYRQDHPCKIEKDGSKSCPVSECSMEYFDKDGKNTWISSGCMSAGWSHSAGAESVKVAACFQ